MIRRLSRRYAAQQGKMLAAGLAAAMTLDGCMVGPNYHRPAAIVSPVFKELQPSPGWSRATPVVAELQKGHWWRIYDDTVLDGLEDQVSINNQNVKLYEANYRQARALVDVDRASLFPTVSVVPSATRSTTGIGSATTASTAQVGSIGTSSYDGRRTSYELEATASWDLDVWGRIRRQVESDVSNAQANAADLANATLSYQATLAEDYFNLRTQDQLTDLLDRTVDSYRRSLQITQNQYDAGLGTTSPSALLQAQTQLESTRAQAINAGVLRAQYEHAIAALIGKPPADLNVGAAPLNRYIPAIPVSVPATLLQRRPDVAAAERAMEQENSLIGVQVAAFFPDISLSAAYGWTGDPLHSLIQAANRLWSLGATGTQVLFEGGMRSAALDEARAAYDGSVATYRQTVLTALEDTEDNLSGLRILAQQADAEARAVILSEQAVQVALNEYRAGTVDYTTVVTSQVTALSNEQTALTIQQDRLTDSVQLIQQLGGGWTDAALPSKGSLQTDNPLIPSFLDKKSN